MITTHAQGVNTVDDEAVLFSFDDHSWPFVQAGRIVMTQPTKYAGNPVMRRGGPRDPDQTSCRLGGTVMIENGKFRMWYVGTRGYGNLPEDKKWEGLDLPLSHQPGDFPKIQSLCYAESDDGVHWTKPDLGYNRNAIKNENMEDNSSFVIKDAQTGEYVIGVHDFPHGTWDPESKMMRVRAFAGEMRLYTSPDGLNLTPVGQGDACPFQFEGGAFFHFQGHYFIGGQGTRLREPRIEGDDHPPGKRTMCTMKSRDWRHWPRGVVYAPMFSGFGAMQNHAGVVCTPRGNVCLGMTGRFQPGESDYRSFNCDLGFAISNDGAHWREPVPNGVYVAYDEEESWEPGLRQSTIEGTFMRQSGPMLDVGDETWIYYSAATMGGNTNYRNYQVGLMTIQRDRFGYMKLPTWGESTYHRYEEMDIHDPAIEMFSCTIECDAPAKLELNYSAGDDATPTTVALWDEDRVNTLTGYTHEDCSPLSGDSLREGVTWKNHDTLPVGQRFTIEIVAGKKARFYCAYIRH